MKKLILISCIFPIIASAQNFHFSVRAGVASYNGDLKRKSFSFSQSSFIGSIGARYDLTEHLTARTYFSLTSLKGDDKKGNALMQARNLNFKTSVFEWELGAQYNFLNMNDSWWTPYVYAGIGVFHFNPYTKDVNGSKTFLKPLSTEGEGVVPSVRKYSLTQFSIPFGFGAERSLNEDMKVGLELGYRKLFTDYLDDVSNVYADEAALLAAKGQKTVDLAYRGDEVGAGPYPGADITRGNPKSKDGYFYIALTYTLRFYFDKYKQTSGLPSYKRDKKMGCPASRLRY
jgi:Outer membrane protein beta-barrel domain